MIDYQRLVVFKTEYPLLLQPAPFRYLNLMVYFSVHYYIVVCE